jgi:hypothetical protein
MYLERLKRALSTERGPRLTFNSGDTEESIELSPEAANQTLQALQVVTSEVAGEARLTLRVLGHQVVFIAAKGNDTRRLMPMDHITVS